MLDDAPPGNARPLPLQRNVILSLLFAQAAAAWAVLLWESANASMDVTMASSTMGMSALVCLAVMMVAMMFPSAVPMILTFHHVQAAKHQRDEAFVLTWVFVGAYILVWTLAGAAAFAVALVTEAIAAQVALSSAAAARSGGAILVAAGIYQFMPFKEQFLAKCRAPITFIASSWRDGAAGALR